MTSYYDYEISDDGNNGEIFVIVYLSWLDISETNTGWESISSTIGSIAEKWARKIVHAHFPSIALYEDYTEQVGTCDLHKDGDVELIKVHIIFKKNEDGED